MDIIILLTNFLSDCHFDLIIGNRDWNIALELYVYRRG